MKSVVHEGKKSWLTGTVKTTCGLTFSPSQEQRQGVFSSVTCPACKAGRKKGK